MAVDLRAVSAQQGAAARLAIARDHRTGKNYGLNRSTTLI